ncbi:uncharacterized protein LOC143452006 isoform X1 [Clavelina lepadiformis]|uniref:uncharacterized protein LOC143452006 isoform X1 n=1 Tax=Clavelina lepadiformis TaxID=159417 RepID=UPI004041CCD6
MFVGFIILILVSLLRSEVSGQCARNTDINGPGQAWSMGSTCSVFNISATRSVVGSIVSYLTPNTNLAAGFQCAFYEGNSTSDPVLGTIGETLAGWVELFQHSAYVFVQCVGLGSDPTINFVATPSIAFERFVNQAVIHVEPPDFPNTNYPTTYLQETAIESKQSTTYMVSFHPTFHIIDPLWITSDDGTGLVYRGNLMTAPEPFNISGNLIKIQFYSDPAGTRSGFRMTLNADLPKPPPAPELICGDQGQISISLSNQTIIDLCENEDDYVIISATSVDDVNLVDPVCKANASDPNFNLGVTDCSTLEVTDGILKAQFLLRCLPKVNESAAIQRYVDGCLNLTCEYNTTELLKAGAILPKIKKVELDSVEEEGRFGVEIFFTTDRSYSVKLSAGAEVEVPDQIYAKMELNSLDDALHVQLSECWATPSDNHNDVTSYQILDNSCPADNAFDTDDAINIDRNYNATYAAFRFRSFVWTNYDTQTIYVYCHVTICHNDVDPGCLAWPSCSRKRKRHVSTSDSLLIASRPIFISKREAISCEEANGGCSDTCEMRNDDVRCNCHPGRVLLGDGRTCQGVENSDIVAGRGSLVILACVITAVVFLVCFLLVWSKEDMKQKNGFRRVI